MTIHVVVHKELAGGAGGANAAPAARDGTYRYQAVETAATITITAGERLARIWGTTEWKWRTDGQPATAAGSPMWPANLPQDLMVHEGMTLALAE